MLIPKRHNVNQLVKIGLRWLRRQGAELTADLGQCPLCRDRTVLPDPLCSYCLIDLPWNYHNCASCAYPLESNTLACQHCLSSPRLFASYSALIYSDEVRWLLTRVKQHYDEPVARSLGFILGNYLHQRRLQPIPDAIVPIPTSNARRRKRGFNLPELLGRYLPPPYQHLQQNLLATQTTTIEQKHLRRAQRLSQTRRFTITGVVPPHVVILDDVITTGATIKAASEVLVDAGAQYIEAWSLARTPVFDGQIA